MLEKHNISNQVENRLLVVIDTSVVVHYLLTSGDNYSSRIFELVKTKEILPVACKETLSELNLKSSLSDKAKLFAKFVAQYKYSCSILELPKVTDSKPISRHFKDDKFLHLVDFSKSKYLITLDKDLLELTDYKQVLILKPKDFLELKGW